MRGCRNAGYIAPAPLGGCSKKKKPECNPPECKWVKGKGCRVGEKRASPKHKSRSRSRSRKSRSPPPVPEMDYEMLILPPIPPTPMYIQPRVPAVPPALPAKPRYTQPKKPIVPKRKSRSRSRSRRLSRRSSRVEMIYNPMHAIYKEKMKKTSSPGVMAYNPLYAGKVARRKSRSRSRSPSVVYNPLYVEKLKKSMRKRQSSLESRSISPPRVPYPSPRSRRSSRRRSGKYSVTPVYSRKDY